MFNRKAKTMIHWVTTSPNPRSRATGYNAGQKGWKLHAIEAPTNAKFSEIKFKQALCGKRAKYGWGLDMFIEDKCQKCLKFYPTIFD